MKDTIDYMIDNTAAQSRAKSAEKRRVLVAIVKEQTGWSAPRGISMKELKSILSQ